jgi:hypothetical protein
MCQPIQGSRIKFTYTVGCIGGFELSSHSHSSAPAIEIPRLNAKSTVRTEIKRFIRDLQDHAATPEKTVLAGGIQAGALIPNFHEGHSSGMAIRASAPVLYCKHQITNNMQPTSDNTVFSCDVCTFLIIKKKFKTITLKPFHAFFKTTADPNAASEAQVSITVQCLQTVDFSRVNALVDYCNSQTPPVSTKSFPMLGTTVKFSNEITTLKSKTSISRPRLQKCTKSAPKPQASAKI